MDELRQIWPDWEIIEVLGQGSYGTVLKAKKKITGHGEAYSAIKIVTLPLNSSEIGALQSSGMDEHTIRAYYRDMAEKLIAEISIMESLKAVNEIVHIQDFKIVEDPHQIKWQIYIRMELLDNINDYIKKHAFTVRDVVKLGTDVCEALVKCQQKNIIHRDIKPANIMVDEYGTFKLGDFGIARQVGTNLAASTKAGAENYMAPEIYRGESYDQTVDIYSLGITMYQFLNNGRMPFLPPYPKQITSNDILNSRIMRLQGNPIPAPELADENLAKIVLRACAFNPRERYQSAQEMLDDLNGLGEGRGPTPPPRGPTPPPEPPKQKNKLKIIIPIAAAFVVAAVVIAFVFIQKRPRPEKSIVDLLQNVTIVCQEEDDGKYSILKEKCVFNASYDEDDENALNFMKKITKDNYDISQTKQLSMGDSIKVSVNVDDDLLNTYNVTLSKNSVTITLDQNAIVIPPTPTPAPEEIYYYANVYDSLYLRSEPSTNGPVIDKIPRKGQMLYLNESSGNMYKVKVTSSGLIGWVNSKYLVLNPNDCTKTPKSTTKTTTKQEPFYGIFCTAHQDESEAREKLRECRQYSNSAEIIVTTDWSNLNSKRYYVVLAGRYSSKSEAKADLEYIKNFYPTAYVKYSGRYKG